MLSRQLNITAKLKSYKVQEMVFSCLRSKIAYENPGKIRDIFKKNGDRDIFSCKLMTCNLDIQNKINTVVDTIIDDMYTEPIFYDGYINKNNKRDAQAYLLYKSNTIYISFRGTNNIGDIIDVIDFRPRTIMKDIVVHNGFYEQFFSIESQITNDIKNIIKLHNIERIIFTGHSLGACVASIAAAYYASMFKDLYITCHTFAMLRTGNDKFVDWFKSGVDECTRIEIQEDIVPLLYINKDFVHIPNGVKLKRSGSVDDKLYESDELGCVDILTTLLKKNELKGITQYHSMEIHIERLLSIKQIRKN